MQSTTATLLVMIILATFGFFAFLNADGKIYDSIGKSAELLSTNSGINLITSQNAIQQFSEVPLFDESALQKRIEEISKLGGDISAHGELEVITSDDFKNKRAGYQYFLKEGTKRYQIYFPINPKLVSSEKLEVSGKVYNNEIVIANYKKIGPVTAVTESNQVIGEQKIAVILVNFQDNPVQPITKDDAWNLVFNKLDPNSVNSFYDEVAYEKIFLDGNVFGWYTLPYSSTSSCHDTYYKAIEAADPDVFFPNYSAIIVMFPYANCPYGGRATIGNVSIATDDGTFFGGYEMINGTSLSSPYVVSHEFGHNLGLWHANYWDCNNSTIGEWQTQCISKEYGDNLDLMGFNLTHLNAIHKETLGLFDPSNILETTQAGTYFIEPIETKTRGLKTLKIPAQSGITYYVEYRRPIGYDSQLTLFFGPAVYNGALLHMNFFDESEGGDTQVLDNTPNDETVPNIPNVVLPIGKTFYDEQNDILITTVSLTDNYLEVRLGVPYCGNGTIDIGEDCDGQNLNGKTCNDLSFIGGGTLECTQQCKFDTAKCIDPVCGPNHIYADGNSCSATFTADHNGSAVVASGQEGWDFVRHLQTGRYIDPTTPPPHQSLAYHRIYLRTKPTQLFDYIIYRNSVNFQTSSIPDNALIESAQLSFWPAQAGAYINTHPNSNDFLTLVRTTLHNPPLLTVEDFGQFDSVDNPTELSNRFDISQQFNLGEQIVFPLNQAGLQNINKTGFSEFGLRAGYDLATTPNSGENTELQVFLWSGNSAFFKPTLTINYTTPFNLCGNNVIDSGEVCDGTSLSSQRCTPYGYETGSLACCSSCGGLDKSNCSYDVMTCTDSDVGTANPYLTASKVSGQTQTGFGASCSGISLVTIPVAYSYNDSCNGNFLTEWSCARESVPKIIGCTKTDCSQYKKPVAVTIDCTQYNTTSTKYTCSAEKCMRVICGDRVCNGGENCSSCSIDCGACPWKSMAS